jgi:hypothetical protein
MFAEWDGIIYRDGYYHFVNHKTQLVSMGFGSESGLRRNADIIRMEGSALKLMHERYLKLFGQGS